MRRTSNPFNGSGFSPWVSDLAERVLWRGLGPEPRGPDLLRWQPHPLHCLEVQQSPCLTCPHRQGCRVECPAFVQYLRIRSTHRVPGATCAHCDSELARGKARFCSSTCAGKWRTKAISLRRKQNG